MNEHYRYHSRYNFIVARGLLYVSWKNIFNLFLFQIFRHWEFHSRWTDESWATVQIEDNITQILPRFKLSAKISKKLSVHKTMYVIFFFHISHSTNNIHGFRAQNYLSFCSRTDGNSTKRHRTSTKDIHRIIFRTKFPVFFFFLQFFSIFSQISKFIFYPCCVLSSLV